MWSHAGSEVLDPYRDQAFFLQTYRMQKALGDLHHLLARRPVNIFSLIKVSQPENLFSVRVIFLKFGTTLQKH